MGTTFEVGDRVRSRVNAQGLRQGEVYVVAATRTVYRFGGGYVTYTMESGQEVGNGHLVLERA